MTPDPTDTTPATGRRTAEAIAETLIDEIRRGVLALDAPLPTERDLCDRFAASRPTVREALALMQRRGYLGGGSGKRPRAARPSLVDVLSAVGDDIRDIVAGKAAGMGTIAAAYGYLGSAEPIDAWQADGTAQVKYRGANWTAIHRPGITPSVGAHRVAELVGNRLLVDPL